MDGPVHIVTAPVILGPRPTGPLNSADYTAACAAGVRAWADLMGRAARRLRTPLGETTPLGEAIAVLLDQETESADQCTGYRCPATPEADPCLVDERDGVIDEPEETPANPTHHHCAWCNAWVRRWEADEPPMVRLATAVLEMA